jgi:hypothetical protein
MEASMQTDVSSTAPVRRESLRDQQRRLDLYWLALEIYDVVAAAVARPGLGALRTQVERASLEAAAWIRESLDAAGQQRRRSLQQARAAIAESAEILDALRVRRLIDPADHQRARDLLGRLGRRLSRRA